MNKLEIVLNSIPYADIHKGVQEIKHMEETGIMPVGGIRQWAARVVSDVDLSYNDARKVIESYVLHKAAYYWAGV